MFPPRTAFDILAYNDWATVQGYREYRPGLPDPGDNNDPGYRWGWANAKRGRTKINDGFEPLRAEFMAMVKRPN